VSDEYATRRDTDQLTGWVMRLERHLEQIDMGGTRGMAVINIQLAELTKDVAELGGESRAWQVAHERQHEHDQAQRVSGRRWGLSLAITNLLGLAAILAAVIHH
jgi:hypothetical protein